MHGPALRRVPARQRTVAAPRGHRVLHDRFVRCELDEVIFDHDRVVLRWVALVRVVAGRHVVVEGGHDPARGRARRGRQEGADRCLGGRVLHVVGRRRPRERAVVLAVLNRHVHESVRVVVDGVGVRAARVLAVDLLRDLVFGPELAGQRRGDVSDAQMVGIVRQPRGVIDLDLRAVGTRGGECAAGRKGAARGEFCCTPWRIGTPGGCGGISALAVAPDWWRDAELRVRRRQAKMESGEPAQRTH